MSVDHQGGKAYGQRKDQQAEDLRAVNKKFLDDDAFKDIEDLAEKLEGYAKKFVEYDLDSSGDIDLFELAQMLEKIGQPKTRIEMKKMIAEVDTNNSGTIHYEEFVQMMIGKKNSILKLILMYEGMAKQSESPKKGDLPPKKSLADLP